MLVGERRVRDEGVAWLGLGTGFGFGFGSGASLGSGSRPATASPCGTPWRASSAAPAPAAAAARRPSASPPSVVAAFEAPCTAAVFLGRSATRRARARRAASPSWTRRFSPTGGPQPWPPSTRAPALLPGQSCRVGLRLMCSAHLSGWWGVCVGEGSEGDGGANLRPNRVPGPQPQPQS